MASLDELMHKYGSDKGGPGSRHNYADFYHDLFVNHRHRVTRFFELGIFGGASLRAWRDFFPGAQIFGADVNPALLFTEERIQTFLCDETKPEQIATLWQDIGAMVDVILDDALHTPESNIYFLERSVHMLKSGGLYIIEDLWSPKGYEKLIDEGWRYVALPHESTPDNNILLWCKP